MKNVGVKHFWFKCRRRIYIIVLNLYLAIHPVFDEFCDNLATRLYSPTIILGNKTIGGIGFGVLLALAITEYKQSPFAKVYFVLLLIYYVVQFFIVMNLHLTGYVISPYYLCMIGLTFVGLFTKSKYIT